MSNEIKVVDARDTEVTGSQSDATEGEVQFTPSKSSWLHQLHEWVKLPPSEVVSVHGRWSNAGEDAQKAANPRH